MDRFLNKKRKKSPEPPQQSGIPTSTVAGPGFPAEMDIDPRGRRSCSYQDLGEIPIVTLGEEDSRDPRIISQGGGRGWGLPAPEASASGVLDADVGGGNGLTSECSRSQRFGPTLTCTPVPLPTR